MHLDFNAIAFPLLALASLGLMLFPFDAKHQGWRWVRIIVGGLDLLYAFVLALRGLSITT